ncbi:MAG: histidinol dehydrogenase, partial [Hyphomonas sp.]
MLRRFNSETPSFKGEFAAFLAEDRGTGHDVASIVRKILEDVEGFGGKAVADYTAKYDELQIDPTTLESDNVNLHALAADCPADLREAIDFAHD